MDDLFGAVALPSQQGGDTDFGVAGDSLTARLLGQDLLAERFGTFKLLLCRLAVGDMNTEGVTSEY